MPKLIVCTLLSFTLFACQKDKQIINSPDNYCPACDSCENFPPDSSSLGRNTIELYNGRKAPFFNPLNNDEFVYIKEQDSNRAISLVTYNMATHIEKTILKNVDVFWQPKWGTSGRITFVNNYQICTINADGSEFKRLTTLPYFQYPDWKNDSIVACQFTKNMSFPYYYAEVNIKNSNIDTFINKFFILGATNGLGEKIFLGSSGLSNLVFSNTKSTYYLSNRKDDNLNVIKGICWSPNNDDVFYSKVVLGIYKVNKNSMEELLIKKGCQKRHYNFLSISPNGKKILTERVDASLSNDKSTISYKSDIYIMDIDGRNEEKVFK